MHLPARVEVLVVDDNSPDGTGKSPMNSWQKTPEFMCFIARARRASAALTSLDSNGRWSAITNSSSKWMEIFRITRMISLPF